MVKSKNNFFLFFGRPEFKSIAGKRYKHLIVLAVVMVISLLAIGIGKSALLLLKKKMDNPFVKFVNVDINYGMLNELNDGALDSLQNSQFLKSRYHYNEAIITRFKNISFVKFTPNKKLSNKTIQALALVSDSESEFYKFLSSNTEIIETQMYFSNNSYGCIVTRSYLDKIGLAENQPLFMWYSSFRDKEPVPIEILGIAKELPENVDVLINRKFFNATQNGGVTFDITSDYHASYSQYFIPRTPKLDEALINLGYEIQYTENGLLNGIYIQKNSEYLESDNRVIVQKYPDAFRTFDLNRMPAKEADLNPERIVFSFDELDSVAAFGKSLLNDNFYRSSARDRLKIDMNIIEDKKNFAFFNKLANFLSIGLITFSIFLIFTYTTNVLVNHISKNQLSLGTLKAFGLSNRRIVVLYTLLSSVLVFTAFISAYFLSNALVNVLLYSINDWIIEEFGALLVVETLNFFLLLGLFVALPIAVIYYTLQRRLTGSTPGDLIYGR